MRSASYGWKAHVMDETAHFMDETAHFMDEKRHFSELWIKRSFYGWNGQTYGKKNTSPNVRPDTRVSYFFETTENAT
jgi:hypothetical protein